MRLSHPLMLLILGLAGCQLSAASWHVCLSLRVPLSVLLHRSVFQALFLEVPHSIPVFTWIFSFHSGNLRPLLSSTSPVSVTGTKGHSPTCLLKINLLILYSHLCPLFEKTDVCISEAHGGGWGDLVQWLTLSCRFFTICSQLRRH